MNRKKKLMREPENENKGFINNEIKNSIFTQPV
jgi:hypothetical protein